VRHRHLVQAARGQVKVNASSRVALSIQCMVRTCQSGAGDDKEDCRIFFTQCNRIFQGHHTEFRKMKRKKNTVLREGSTRHLLQMPIARNTTLRIATIHTGGNVLQFALVMQLRVFSIGFDMFLFSE
jgi:hypothetical protein